MCILSRTFVLHPVSRFLLALCVNRDYVYLVLFTYF